MVGRFRVVTLAVQVCILNTHGSIVIVEAARSISDNSLVVAGLASQVRFRAVDSDLEAQLRAGVEVAQSPHWTVRVSAHCSRSNHTCSCSSRTVGSWGRAIVGAALVRLATALPEKRGICDPSLGQNRQLGETHQLPTVGLRLSIQR
jgi:hypothetical protein